MLKAKYYPKHNVMEAKLGSNASFLWRSFIWGKELLEKGVRWRVGDGRSIKVFGDPWVPGLENFKLSSRNGVDSDMFVANLMVERGVWNLSLLEQIFSEQEREAILKIPLIRTGRPDACIWNYCKNGRYEVKSGYWLAREEVREASLNHVFAPLHYWKHLWKLKVPPKMLHFLWRCSMGFIPCMEALQWKRITQTAQCFRCQQENESPVHATWSCAACVAVFERATFFSSLSSGQYPSFISFFDHAMKTVADEELQLLVILLWMNWHDRNKAYHQESTETSDRIFDNGVRLLAEWNNANIRNGTANRDSGATFTGDVES
ncbi:putative reverse transcriptase zinc-binding domain-containing protein [Rosa chinensis]|uniref:Putative reverse transcriptase zinc-binding domain-containing protein n=1 Tax=Rosa chinensis TaxID=74649 RepID=A0A2P6P9Q5_ROSCH|nr:putative reverse transcriptase zinc-binding domain-containing protein [Rosa chinensis]